MLFADGGISNIFASNSIKEAVNSQLKIKATDSPRLVTSEINKYIEQSSNTVTMIQDIVKQVLMSVDAVSTSADETLENMGKENDTLLASVVNITDEYSNTQENYEILFDEFVSSLTEIKNM